MVESRAPKLSAIMFARHFFWLPELREVPSVIACDFYFIEDSSAVTAK